MGLRYFAMIDGERRGPFTLDQLVEAGVTPETYVWCKGMPDWVQAREDGEICRYFRRRIFDRMHPQAPPPPTAADAPQEDPLADIPLGFRRIVRRSGELPQKPAEPVEHEHVVPPRSRLIDAIMVTLLCCPLTGIVAIYFAYKTNELWLKNQRNESYDMARKAKMWIGITIFLGVMLNAFAFLMLKRSGM